MVKPARSHLVVCPKCTCHAKLDALQCPCCGFRATSPDSWITPAAAILAMGLTAAGCSDETGGGSSGTGGMGGTTSQSTVQAIAGYTVAVSTTATSSTAGGGANGGEGGSGGAGGGGGAGGK